MKKEMTARYFAFHWGQFISGLFLLITGITGFFFYNEGLLNFLFSLPPFIWTGLVPLILSVVFISRTFIMMEQVYLTSDHGIIQVQTKRIWKNKVKYEKKAIKFVGIRYSGSKFKRWAIIMMMLLVAYEVYYKNGIDLLGYASIGPYLIFCFFMTISAILCYACIQRRFIEIGTDNETRFIPLPSLRIEPSKMRKLLNILNIDDDSVIDLSNTFAIKKLLKENIFYLILGTFFIAIATCLMIFPLFYLGDFTVPLSLALGMKILLRVFQGNKKYAKMNDGTLYKANSVEIVFKKVANADCKERQVIGATRIHALEMIACFYLISQGIKYGFRFAWWAYASFNGVYFAVGVAIILLIFVRWFVPITLIDIDFGTFSISIKVHAGKDDDRMSHAGAIEVIRHKINHFMSAFTIMKKNRKQLAIGLIFVILLLVPIFYYSLVHSSLIF